MWKIFIPWALNEKVLLMLEIRVSGAFSFNFSVFNDRNYSFTMEMCVTPGRTMRSGMRSWASRSWPSVNERRISVRPGALGDSMNSDRLSSFCWRLTIRCQPPLDEFQKIFSDTILTVLLHTKTSIRRCSFFVPIHGGY